MAVVVLVIAGTSRFSLALTAEAAVVPKSTDNFYEARARLWLPDESGQRDGILVLLKGTDSDARNLAGSDEWQGIARKNNLAILGCHFRGDGEPYEQAEGGSGAALLAMINQLAKNMGRPELARIPLYLVGHSSGAMFAYNFTCWRPDRVGSFVSVKSGPISPKANAEAMLIPGLFIVGLNDLSGRLRSTVEAFGAAVRAHRWTLAIEERGGHGWTNATHELVSAYLAATTRASSAETLSLRRALPTSKNDGPGTNPHTVWLPNETFAAAWETRSAAIPISEVLLAGRNDEQPNGQPRVGEIDLGEIDLTKDSLATGTVQLDSALLRAAGSLHLESEDSRIRVVSTRRSQDGIDLEWVLKTDRLSVGWFRSQLIANTGPNSEKLLIPVRAKLVGPISATPASAYVGVMPRGKTVSQTITLSAPDADLVADLRCESSRPDFAKASIGEKRKNGTVDLSLTFDGSKGLGNQSGFFTVRAGADQQPVLKFPFIVWVSK